MRLVAVRHCAGTMTDNGSAMSGPPLTAEPAVAASANSDTGAGAAAGPEAAAEPSFSAASAGSFDGEDHTRLVDFDLFIREMKKRPVLYKSARTEYREMAEKEMAWDEICAIVYFNWDQYSTEKKRHRKKELRKRWNNMTEEFFRRYVDRPLSPATKKRKNIFDSMTFLLEATAADDVDMGAYGVISANSNNINEGFAPIMDPLMPAPEIPILAMPSTSAVVSMSEPTQSHSANPNPNIHFSFMLVPLLNRLSQDKLYAVWPKILKVIQEAEEAKKLQILQDELIYPPDVEPAALPELEPEPEATEEEEGPVYSCSHGRPKNPDGEIIYPETDHEDD